MYKDCVKFHTLLPRWSEDALNCHVRVLCQAHDDVLNFTFEVEESKACFRLEHDHDGAECWEDSCVEVFLQSCIDPSVYFNFECNAGGYILAEMGQSRAGRRRFTPAEYAKLQRKATILANTAHDVRWQFCLSVPMSMIGVTQPKNLRGNLYKCASKAKCVHYMSAFEVASERPDFHRPESFQLLF